MNETSSNNPDGHKIFSGTKEVAENLRFNESGLQEWFGDNISSAGKIVKIAQFKGSAFLNAVNLQRAQKKQRFYY